MASRETERARAAGFSSYRQFLNARALERGFPSFSMEARAHRYERQHPPKKEFAAPRPMRMFVRESAAPGAYREVFATPLTYRDASEVAKHRQAIAKFLTPRTTREGDRALSRFETLTVNTRELGPVQLLVNRDTLRELGRAGEFDFGYIYEAPNG